MSVTEALQNSIRVTTIVCGWILIFKVILAYVYLATDFLKISHLNVYIGGILELSNGCVQLSQLCSPALRFILSSAFLGFGGLCILLQTASVVNGLGICSYLLGKLIQLGISTILGIFTSLLLFGNIVFSPLLIVIILLICIFIFIVRSNYIKRYGNFTQNAV